MIVDWKIMKKIEIIKIHIIRPFLHFHLLDVPIRNNTYFILIATQFFYQIQIATVMDIFFSISTID